ncbi:MAG: hypothetical protein DRO93_14595 [Candidatus Thorarchaeota archaeon]|nr:MAG: hypothetical protein DRO93_14595 [Candidatus Thorarchaeota archaeon]
MEYWKIFSCRYAFCPGAGLHKASGRIIAFYAYDLVKAQIVQQGIGSVAGSRTGEYSKVKAPFQCNGFTCGISLKSVLKGISCHMNNIAFIVCNRKINPTRLSIIPGTRLKQPCLVIETLDTGHIT